MTLQNSTDSTFGYSTQNPLKLKKGNQEKSFDYSILFLKGLKTNDGQDLLLLQRVSTRDPNFKESKIKLTNRYSGMPLSGKLGLLDKYIFVTSNTKDTVTIFVDIYNKGALQIPVGLKYEQK